MRGRYAVLLDGGFVRKRLESRARAALRLSGELDVSLERIFPAAADVLRYASAFGDHERLQGMELLRVFYYDAPPLSGTKQNPYG